MRSRGSKRRRVGSARDWPCAHAMNALDCETAATCVASKMGHRQPASVTMRPFRWGNGRLGPGRANLRRVVGFLSPFQGY